MTWLYMRGREQTVPVLGIPDSDGLTDIASNYGRAHHPAWYLNLRANPQAAVVVDGVARDVEAREVFGPERDSRLERATSLYPGFGVYERRARPRRIPVLVLAVQ